MSEVMRLAEDVKLSASREATRDACVISFCLFVLFVFFLSALYIRTNALERIRE